MKDVRGLLLGASLLGCQSTQPPPAPADAFGGLTEASWIDREEIVAFMEHEVMPFARGALGPLVGGPDRVTCATCHGDDAEAHDWRMPAVRALPDPDLQSAGMERYASLVDSQMRNAVYGYLTEDGKQHRAAYMRGEILPGMARLLGRPPYDFTQSYRYNRARGAFGCYHCHLVAGPAEAASGPGR